MNLSALTSSIDRIAWLVEASQHLVLVSEGGGFAACGDFGVVAGVGLPQAVDIIEAVSSVDGVVAGAAVDEVISFTAVDFRGSNLA